MKIRKASRIDGSLFFNIFLFLAGGIQYKKLDSRKTNEKACEVSYGLR